MYRLICKETVEEKILQRASQKSTVQQLVMTGGHVQGDLLAPEDVLSLLIDDAQLERKIREIPFQVFLVLSSNNASSFPALRQICFGYPKSSCDSLITFHLIRLGTGKRKNLEQGVYELTLRVMHHLKILQTLSHRSMDLNLLRILRKKSLQRYQILFTLVYV